MKQLDGYADQSLKMHMRPLHVGSESITASSVRFHLQATDTSGRASSVNPLYLMLLPGFLREFWALCASLLHRPRRGAQDGKPRPCVIDRERSAALGAVSR